MTDIRHHPLERAVLAAAPGATLRSMELARLIDPADPRAPSEAVWAQLSPAERAWVIEQLPAEEEPALMPEGDLHDQAVRSATSALRAFWQRTRRKAYVGSDLNVYYPAERRFAPDCFVVLDVEAGPRERWVVSAEGKGLDFVLEVTFHGDHKKDAERNVEWFARLGIPEYFVLDGRRRRLTGYRLGPQGTYAAIVPQRGRFSSTVLGLDLALEGNRVRFYMGTAPLLDADELRAELERTVDDAVARAEQEAARAEHEAARALEAVRARVVDLCELLDVDLHAARRAELAALDVEGATQLADRIKRDRRWPG